MKNQVSQSITMNFLWLIKLEIKFKHGNKDKKIKKQATLSFYRTIDRHDLFGVASLLIKLKPFIAPIKMTSYSTYDQW